MVEEGKRQEYRFTKRFLHEIKREGCYLGDLETEEQTGMLFDKDYNKLKLGKTIKRTVVGVGDHSATLRMKRNPDELWIKNVFRVEETGFIKDMQDMDEYPFSKGDDIEIRIKINNERKEIKIYLKYIGRSW